MGAERVGVVLLFTSAALFVAALASPVFLFAHWLSSIGALAVVAFAPRKRKAALVALAFLLVALPLGLLGSGIGIGTRGVDAAPGDVDAAASTLIAYSGPLAYAVYSAFALAGGHRIAAAVGAGGGLLGIAAIFTGAPDALIGLGILGGAAVGILSLVPHGQTLRRAAVSRS